MKKTNWLTAIATVGNCQASRSDCRRRSDTALYWSPMPTPDSDTFRRYRVGAIPGWPFRSATWVTRGLASAPHGDSDRRATSGAESHRT